MPAYQYSSLAQQRMEETQKDAVLEYSREENDLDRNPTVLATLQGFYARREWKWQRRIPLEGRSHLKRMQ